MQMGRAHRWLNLVRLCTLGVFAMALVLQPMFAAASELHELKHDPSGGHAHVLHSGNVADELTAVDAPDDGAGVLHTLLHFSHCSGDLAVLPVASASVAAPLCGRLATTHTIRTPETRLPAPFKPPIFA